MDGSGERDAMMIFQLRSKHLHAGPQGVTGCFPILTFLLQLLCQSRLKMTKKPES
jgi:hypothetical protein